MNDNETSPYKKPPLVVKIFLWIYSFMWFNTLFIAGLNSIAMKAVDYDSLSMFVSLTMGLYFIFKYLPKLY